jgi:hypothetical protein
MSKKIERPTGIVPTPLGAIRFTMTEAAHVFLHTESRDGEVIIIRGIPYHCSYHCRLIDREWTAEDYNNPYLSRKDVFNKEASQAARAVARRDLATAWSEYLAAHSDLSRQAEQASMAEQVESLESELADLRKKTADKAAELQAAKKKQVSL